MAPVSTGLGEIYQYVVFPEKGYEEQYDATQLRTIQDWIIKPQLIGTKGVAEVNTLGGYLKQYEFRSARQAEKYEYHHFGDIRCPRSQQ